MSAFPQTPTGPFELFLDDDVIDLIIENSTKYAGLRGNHNFSTTKKEIRVFVAIPLISGYSKVPRRRLYWSSDEDVRNEAVLAAMNRDRFDEIMRYEPTHDILALFVLRLSLRWSPM